MKLRGQIFGMKAVDKNRVQLQMYLPKGSAVMEFSADDLRQLIQDAEDTLKEMESMPTPLEKRALRSLHLQGKLSKTCGNAPMKERHTLLLRLIQKGLLNDNLELTQKGIDASV